MEADHQLHPGLHRAAGPVRARPRAQRAAIARFAEAEGMKIIAELVEVETGKGADALERRPELAAALAEGAQGSAL